MNIAIIPARSGSKRIQDKNIKLFNGKPIIAYSIEAAKKSGLFDRIIVSSDSDKYLQIADEYGAEAQERDKKLCDDMTGMDAVLKYVVKTLGKKFDNVCCIYACAPFITDELLKDSYKKFIDSKATSLIPVCEYPAPIEKAYFIKDNRLHVTSKQGYLARSQDLKPKYYEAGSFYWTVTEHLFKRSSSNVDAVPYLMKSYYCHDIDTYEDWITAEMKYKLYKL